MALNKIAWIGRFTGPKGELARRILQEVVPQFPHVHFTFIGGSADFSIPDGQTSHVSLISQFVTDIRAEINRHDLIIGAGRVAMEAMRCGKPVIAIGERRYVGLVDQRTIALAKHTNFGDSDWQNDFNLAALTKDLQDILSGNIIPDVSQYPEYLREYDIHHVHKQVMQVYQLAGMDRYLNQFAEIPVLMYHRVVDAPVACSRYNIYVTREEMDWQLAALQRRGFTTTTFRDLWQGEKPRKPVILTFDDGYQDNHDNLLPLLQKYRAKAVIYALGDRGIRDNAWDIPAGEPPAPLMDDAQLRACHDSGLIEIGSHGLRHSHLPTLTDTELQRELQESKYHLERVTNAPILSFAYPYGDYGDREAAAVTQAGYQFGIGTVNGPRRFVEDRFRIRRITMFPRTKPSMFWKKTSGFYLRYCQLKGKDF